MSTINPFWDLANETIRQENFSSENKKLKDKLDIYQKNPKKIKINRFLIVIIPILIGIALFVIIPPFAIFCIVGGIIGSFGYTSHVHNIQKDLVKLMIAEEKDWAYSPEERRKRWLLLSSCYDKFFKKGDEDQTLEDEIWGKFSFNQKDINFWTGIFKYAVVTYDSKGNRQKQTFRENCIAFELEKKMKTDFRLVPEGIGSKIMNFFTKKEINTESTNFNKTFAVYYNGKKTENELEIVKTLSPAMQEKLLTFVKDYGRISIWFRENVVLITFHKFFLNKMKTNFFKKVEIEESDKESLQTSFKEILTILGEISQYLD